MHQQRSNQKNCAISILGDGQLAMMLKEAAPSLPIHLNAIDFKQYVDTENLGESFKAQFQNQDVVTFETENITAQLISQLPAHLAFCPPLKALETAQDRFKEKSLFDTLSIPTNRFKGISTASDIDQAVSELGLPMVLKTRQFGYDGKGQALITNHNQITTVAQKMADQPLIAESHVDFDYEVSQIATRDQNGHIVYFPLVRNIHWEGILRETHLLSQDDEHIRHLQQKARHITGQLMAYFDYVGTMAVEFFVVGDELKANEIAPRVHNSGHWSIDGCRISQFANHLRAISGLELKQPLPAYRYAMMVNLIGEDLTAHNADVLEKDPAIDPKCYGKALRPKRKMGHINITANNKDTFRQAIHSVYQTIDAPVSVYAQKLYDEQASS